METCNRWVVSRRAEGLLIGIVDKENGALEETAWRSLCHSNAGEALTVFVFCNSGL